MSNTLSMFRGDNKSWTLTFTNESGTAINISGYTIYFTVKNKFNYTDDVNDSDAVISSDITSHSIATDGKSILSITSSQTSSITPNTYYYDMQLKDTSSQVQTFITGDFILYADVTRRM